MTLMVGNKSANELRAKPFLDILKCKGIYGASISELATKTGKSEHAIKSIMGWAVKNGCASKHKLHPHWYIEEKEEEIVNNETRNTNPCAEIAMGNPQINSLPVPEAEMSPEKLYHQMVLGMALYVAGVAMEKLK